ncbi:p-loop containing nucleoside triphosphate hydrolase protein [Mycena sanguinolenta]|uniref:p-loop containing nucleoside triphosphate hydrolase protein n=1 Tax=Mycena sanguinolenta TaxID=230812 RepID=A0A8H7DMA6_9AGAR|nr:p-loop containing nucleoside triphosphate hydrolase protein [Mycena sanguinolenta]
MNDSQQHSLLYTDSTWSMDSASAHRRGIWTHSLFVPLYSVAVSAVFLSVHMVHSLLSKHPPSIRPRSSGEAGQDARAKPEIYAKKNYSLVFKLLRVLGCISLMGLAIISSISDGGWRMPVLSEADWLNIGMTFTFLYLSILSLASLFAAPSSTRTFQRHLNGILAVVFGVYFYRDIYPLATFANAPQDLSEGWLLWVKLCLLGLIAVLLPLIEPRPYTPVDPMVFCETVPPLSSLLNVVIRTQCPCPTPNKQLRSFPSSYIFFLDQVVFLAHRLPHLPLEMLPPLADYDHAQHLQMRSFPHMDRFSGAKRRHIFFGIMRVFRVEYTVLALTTATQVAANFLSPVGVNRLLNYMETNGKDATYRPWVWVLWIFLGPTLRSMCNHWYVFIVTRTLVRLEAIITQLIFEHALRIRFKSETSMDINQSSGSTARGSRNLVGKLNNLVTSDLQNITDAKDFMLLFVNMPLQLILCIWFLYVVLGWSAFVGLATILMMLPRSRETMNLLRMIKLFAWERKIGKEIDTRREIELSVLWKRRLVDMVQTTMNLVIPVITMIATFATYTIIMKQELNASKVFSSMTVFDMLRSSLQLVFLSITQLMTGKVSLDRVDNFLKETELLDRYSENSQDALSSNCPDPDLIGFHNAKFTWSETSDGVSTPGGRNFVLHIDDLVFKRGCLNLVLGPTGAGKTSILMALLGEMHFIPASPDSWFNLPRGAGVAYVAQESWVQNETILSNITFGAARFDENRYAKVINQCCLEQDLELFAAGDNTEVGERGQNLSGGQKARITLARALFSTADIVLLDDVFSALDVHTANSIVERVFNGDLVIGRTIILVTHNIALVKPYTQFAISLGSDGKVLSQGSITDALVQDQELLARAALDHEILEKAQQEKNDGPPSLPAKTAKKSGKLVVEEEIDIGRVGWPAMRLYLRGLDGGRPFFFFPAFILGLFLYSFSSNFQTWYLGHWAAQYDTHPPADVPVFYYLGVYGCILLFALGVYCSSYLLYMFGIIRASQSLHRQLIDSILGTTLRWLDITPTSRVITRCTQDIRAIDNSVSRALWLLSDLTSSMLIKFGAVVLFTPIFFIPAIALFAMGGWCGRIYMAAQLSVKREMSNARAPVLGHFGAAMAGLTSIRAYGREAAFITDLQEKINHYTRCARVFYNLNRWVAVRLELLSTLFTTALAAYLVYFQNQQASNAGFSLTMTLGFSGMILVWIRCFNDFEVQSNSLERIQRYLTIEQEPAPTKEGTPPAYWPSSGALRVENLFARYSSDGPQVLHGLSFSLEAGEHIGVVGRTGSGKSSLTLALLRAIPTEGNVYYDGLPTTSINLNALRSNITIIPQSPELLAGTLRHNLDILDQHEDAELHHALRAVGLQLGEENGITLETLIASGGSNLSVGQRQQIALARALVRQSKVLILDEATSAIDYEKDALIQEALQNELGNDVTVIVVAHRLSSVMNADKVMVLDAGRIVEFGAPKELLKDQNGRFRALVDESEDRETLYRSR